VTRSRVIEVLGLLLHHLRRGQGPAARAGACSCTGFAEELAGAGGAAWRRLDVCADGGAKKTAWETSSPGGLGRLCWRRSSFGRATLPYRAGRRCCSNAAPCAGSEFFFARYALFGLNPANPCHERCPSFGFSAPSLIVVRRFPAGGFCRASHGGGGLRSLWWALLSPVLASSISLRFRPSPPPSSACFMVDGDLAFPLVATAGASIKFCSSLMVRCAVCPIFVVVGFFLCFPPPLSLSCSVLFLFYFLFCPGFYAVVSRVAVSCWDFPIWCSPSG